MTSPMEAPPTALATQQRSKRTPCSGAVEEMLSRVRARSEEVDRRLAGLGLAMRRFREAVAADEKEEGHA